MLTIEVDVFEVHMICKTTKKVLRKFSAGQDYDRAVSTKDAWDLEGTGTTYTVLETYSEEIEE